MTIAVLSVRSAVYDAMESLVRGPRSPDAPDDGTAFDREARFRNGHRMAIPYAQAVLFDRDGQELGSDVSDGSFGGTYTVTSNEVDYTVRVAKRATPSAIRNRAA